jgi:hypothetical protein
MSVVFSDWVFGDSDRPCATLRDFDGDTVSSITVLSNEANHEIKEYLDSPRSMVSTHGTLFRGLKDSKVCKFSLFNLSYMPE